MRVLEKCRFNAAIDRAQHLYAVKLCFMTEDERYAIDEAIKVGIRHGGIDEISATLCDLDPALCNMWLGWKATVEAEAWRAILTTVFLHGQGEVA
jgi:hypothetical protein